MSVLISKHRLFLNIISAQMRHPAIPAIPVTPAINPAIPAISAINPSMATIIFAFTAYLCWFPSFY